MTVDELINLVSALPSAREAGDKSYWSGVIPAIVGNVVDEIAMSHDFDFTINEYSTTTTSGQAEYTLTGENHDLRDIIAIRYDSTEVMQRMRRLDAYDLLDEDSTIGSVSVWYQSGVDSSGFPKVTLVDTPSATKTLKVTYRKRNIPLSAIPNDFGWVIAQGVIAWVDPRSRGDFNVALRKMIRRYQFGGKDVNLAQMDPHIARTNVEISDLNGAG